MANTVKAKLRAIWAARNQRTFTRGWGKAEFGLCFLFLLDIACCVFIENYLAVCAFFLALFMFFRYENQLLRSRVVSEHWRMCAMETLDHLRFVALSHSQLLRDKPPTPEHKTYKH